MRNFFKFLIPILSNFDLWCIKYTYSYTQEKSLKEKGIKKFFSQLQFTQRKKKHENKIIQKIQAIQFLMCFIKKNI